MMPKDDDDQARQTPAAAKRADSTSKQKAESFEPPAPKNKEEVDARQAFGDQARQFLADYTIETTQSGITFRCERDGCGAAFKVTGSMLPKTAGEVEALTGPIQAHVAEHKAKELAKPS
jgi:hypothetical protein